jgi:hypothetical protein
MILLEVSPKEQAASDAFPSRAVGPVVGFWRMCGGIGGMLMLLVAGERAAPPEPPELRLQGSAAVGV